MRILRALAWLVAAALAPSPSTAASRFPEICQSQGKFYWAEGRTIIADEMLNAIIREEGTFTAGYCSCYDLRRDCEAETPGQCIPLLRECNGAINSGGSFCKANKWGGQTCFR